jgi:hypothetical protein
MKHHPFPSPANHRPRRPLRGSLESNDEGGDRPIRSSIEESVVACKQMTLSLRKQMLLIPTKQPGHIVRRASEQLCRNALSPTRFLFREMTAGAPHLLGIRSRRTSPVIQTGRLPNGIWFETLIPIFGTFWAPWRRMLCGGLDLVVARYDAIYRVITKLNSIFKAYGPR